MDTTHVSDCQRILVGSVSAQVRVTLLDQDGEPAAAAGTLTVDLARADGTSLASGRATAAGATVGAYTATLTAAECASLDVLVATWLDGTTVRATTYHRVVGGFMFQVAELRALPSMGNPTAFPNDALSMARDWITSVIERATGAAWSPRYDLYSAPECRTVGSWVAPCRPLLAVRSVLVDGVAESVTDLDVDRAAGIVRPRIGWYPVESLAVAVEHGYAAPTDALKRAALIAAKWHLLNDTGGINQRAVTISNDVGGTTSFARHDPYRAPTGLPDVDAVIVAHDHRLPGIA